MTRRWPRVLIPLLLLSFVAVPPALAGTTGKLTGKVTNEKKEAMAGVNIRLEGQRLGAISDDQGGYVIIGVPAGTYVVRANLMGSAPWVGENVVVTPDFTTELNIVLKTEAVQMAEVKVEAERPLLQKDATSTTRFLSADQISRMPTRGYQEAVAQQAGIVAFQRQIDRESQNGPTLIIRGGRPNETAYYVDGFSQQDPLTGNSTTSINNNAIQEVVVLNGGFNAEYGRIMSGVVNVITKEGASAYSGSVEAVTDNLGGSPGSSFLGAHAYDYNVYDGNFGGPIIRGRDAGSFYVSGQRRWWGDRAPNGNFDGPLQSNSLGGWTGQAKLALPLANNINLKLGGLYSDDDWREYLNSYRFDLMHNPRYQDKNRSMTAVLTHTLSAKTFYALGGSYFYTERKRGDGLYFDNIDMYGKNPQADFDTAIPWFWPGTSDPNSPLGSVLNDLALAAGGNGHVFDDYLRRQSSYWAARGDLTSQVNAYHQVKAGAEGDWHTLRYYDHYFPVNFPSNTVDIDRYGFSADGRTYENSGPDGPRKPVTISGYVQDKYERAGLVVNTGLRYDYINVNTNSLRSEQFPLGQGSSTLDPTDLTASKTYSRLSPRLGIGFPVNDKMVMHVNWGQFFQQPNLQDLYVSYRFLEHKVQTGGYFVGFGNPNLKPEQTTAYEVGIANQIGDRARFDISAYYKDVKDLVEIATVASYPNSFSTYQNKDFATIKGVDMSFTLRRVNHVQVNVAYSLSYAEGTGSVSNTQRNIAWTASQPPKQTAPLDFDQRHKLSLNLDYSLGNGEGPKFMGGTWLDKVDINVLYNVQSGTPYTPTSVFDEVTLAAVSSLPSGPLNSRYAPWTQSLDMKAGKSFLLGGMNMNAYIWVLNAFDIKNAVSVYTGTGSPLTTSFLNTSDGAAASQNLSSKYGLDASSVYSQALQNQSLYSTPRQVRFGLRMGF